MSPSSRPAVLEHLPWRIAGLVLLGVLVVAYHPEQGGPTNRLIIPVCMAVATWMLVQNAAAVTLGAGLLAGIHSEPDSADWISSLAYPALAGLCALGLAAVLLQRFRRRISETRETRWERRRERTRSPNDRNQRP